MKSKINYVAYVATSIDGRISKNKLSSNTSWGSKEDWNFFQKSLAKFDVVVVGHNTFVVAKTKLSKRNTIVFTSKVKKPKAVGSVTFLNPKFFNILDFFESKGYKNIAILGGSKIYDFFLKNKMFNYLYVTIEPYIFTTGIPMFSGNLFKKYKFSLQSIKRINKMGTILLKYKNES